MDVPQTGSVAHNLKHVLEKVEKLWCKMCIKHNVMPLCWSQTSAGLHTGSALSGTAACSHSCSPQTQSALSGTLKKVSIRDERLRLVSLRPEMFSFTCSW